MHSTIQIVRCPVPLTLNTLYANAKDPQNPEKDFDLYPVRSAHDHLLAYSAKTCEMKYMPEVHLVYAAAHLMNEFCKAQRERSKTAEALNHANATCNPSKANAANN